jgi:Transposase, Mutator family
MSVTPSARSRSISSAASASAVTWALASLRQREEWGALREVFGETREQRCWFHKTANVLAALPKSAHPGAKKALAEIWNAEDKQHALTPSRSSRPPTAPSSARPSPRSPTTGTSCWRSTTSQPSTGSTCAPSTRLSRPSPPSGSASGLPRAPVPVPPASRWPSSSSSPPRPAGARSTHPAWSPWSAPARGPGTASSPDDPANQEVISKPRDQGGHETGRHVGHTELPGQARLLDGGMDGLRHAGWAGR